MKIILILFLIICSFQLSAQTFEVNKLESLIFMSSALAIDLSNNYFDDKFITNLSESEIESLDKDNVPFFDRIGFQPYSKELKDWSDFTVRITIGSALVLAYEKDYFLDNLVVLLEVALAQEAVCKWVKTISKRARPFVYDDEISLQKKQQDNSRRSFYSSHSSTAFSAATFGYYVFHDRNGYNIPVAILLFGSATATAVLRVASAQHFPSDVVVGAIMGSSISYLVCRMNRSDKLDLELGINSIGINYKF